MQPLFQRAEIGQLRARSSVIAAAKPDRYLSRKNDIRFSALARPTFATRKRFSLSSCAPHRSRASLANNSGIREDRSRPLANEEAHASQ